MGKKSVLLSVIESFIAIPAVLLFLSYLKKTELTIKHGV
jgi:hypothetical protein